MSGASRSDRSLWHACPVPGLLICPKVSESWPHPRYLPDKLGSDRKTRQCHSLTLRASLTRQSFLPNSGVWKCESLWTHCDIAVTSRQPLIPVETWSSHPHRRLSRHPQAVRPKNEAHNSSFLATVQQPCPFSGLTPSPGGEDWEPSAFQLRTGH